MQKIFTTLLLALSLPLSASATEKPVKGAGSTAAAAIYQGWAKGYQRASDISVDYEAIGSGAGVKKAVAREADFGATDVALPESELQSHGLLLIPIGITGIVPVINLPKPVDKPIRLTGELLARIFTGDISKWNHSDLVQLNPNLATLDLPIRVVVRSDSSGSTFNFSDYLSKASPEWSRKMGAKSTFSWPEGFLATKGSSGVVKAMQDTKGAIGYVDYSYVSAGKLQPVQLKNTEGEFTTASADAFRKALMNSEWVSAGTFTSALTQRPGKGVWPITMGTYAVVPKVFESARQGANTLGFLAWGFQSGDATVTANSFVRLPDRVQAAAFKVMSGIKDKAGNGVPIQLN